MLLGALLAGGCIQATWSREGSEEPITGVMTAPLSPGATLSGCLDRLGAPVFVYETPRGGYALIYAWRDDVGWGLRLTIPIARLVSANFRYTQLDRESPSVALFFGPDDRLVQWQRGRLGQFLQQQFVDPDDAPEDR
jgi:hypothetical protein